MLSELCVRRPVFATMLVMSLVVLGLFSFRDLGVDLFPRADPATVNVSLALPGASPDEISSSVIEPMEEAISGVSGIDEISARISEGKGNVTVRFVLERDLNDAVNDVREKVAGAIKSVPPELLPPVITKVDPDAAPVMSIMVSSDAMSLRTLTELADKQISRSIQTANGVGQVTIAGTRSREIHIVVDIEKLNSYGLSMAQVRDAIVAENVEIPGGAVEQGKGQLLLRTLGRIDAADDFNNVVVATKNGTPIRVSDIGYAEDSFERPTSSVWFGDKPAVQLDVRRAMGENTVAVIEGVRARLQSIQRALPTSVKVTIVADDSKFIYASIASLEEHLIFGSLFAAIVVMFFIRNIRAVIIAALAIPASIISSFTLMSIMGFTLNNMTLLGITLAVGIVIDDAIVVLENIFRYIEEKDCAPFDAAIQGTREVALAVMATTLSLVVIFLPIAFMNGYAKRFINPFRWTIAFEVLKEFDGIDGIAQIEPLVNPSGSGAAGGGGGSNVTHVHFNFQALPIDQRKQTQSEIITEIRKRLARHPAYRPSITSRNALGSGEGQGGYAISANILGPDLAPLTDYSMKALAAAQRTPSLAEPKLSLSVSNPEIHVAVDRRRAADLGVRMATIGNTLRLAVAGDDRISFYKEGQEQYPIKIRVLENQRRDAAEIGRLTVPSLNGPVRIDNIARVERGLGPSALQRSNRQVTVMLTSDVAPGHALDEASTDLRKLLAGLGMPPTMSFRLQGQSKILDETTANLILAIGLAMIFVYMVLASQFESFVQPIVIMLALPIAVPFALLTRSNRRSSAIDGSSGSAASTRRRSDDCDRRRAVEAVVNI